MRVEWRDCKGGLAALAEWRGDGDLNLAFWLLIRVSVGIGVYPVFMSAEPVLETLRFRGSRVLFLKRDVL